MWNQFGVGGMPLIGRSKRHELRPLSPEPPNPIWPSLIFNVIILARALAFFCIFPSGVQAQFVDQFPNSPTAAYSPVDEKGQVKDDHENKENGSLQSASSETLSAEARNRTRIKDVASIEGIRENQLIGYGIVVGLKGTGDTQQTVYPIQTLLSTLERMGINVPQTGNNSASNMQVKNMAGVFVVATLPAFSRPGSKLDVTVSSGGDARSLEGGVLLMTPLYGPDGQIYAQAQGSLVLGGYQVTGVGAGKSVNHPTTARVPSGALVERIVPFDLKDMHIVNVVLNDADFHTAERMAMAINSLLKVDRARVTDSRRVEIAVEPAEDLPALLDRIESVEIDVYPKARVVVNERTGTVVIGGKVRLQPVSILHGGLSINVVTDTNVSQPNALSSGTTQVTQQTTIQAVDKPVNRIELKDGATVEDLVQELQQIGATARDVISILQGMKEAGALEADLEIL